ncbi:NAD(P)-dependent oxidoreductase [Galbitalea sp. SE-J8]|uniref:NAD(P)-dependent oxidoreductase n=1 Tax=Galbitalea sp. SE-J8 TaxID=3054952 RepID=UPI00259CA01F|nr:NAD(P)-dependent oxidoreductase [Galbitalea sp. SE-J8]MDM4762022.1 NAD(P)-dependent oxidoreductase [Galbitalea sp. SE-J8]
MSAVRSVTVLGLGTMGAAMAARIAGAGFDVTVWNRSPERTVPLRDVARVAPSAAEAVEGADAVLTMLFDADAVRAVMATALPAMRPGAIWMQSSTVGTLASAELARRASAAGVRYVDAPMLGTKAPAQQGRLTALLAGADTDLAELEPVVRAVASKSVRIGDAAPAASGLKLAANAWIATITAGIAQSLTIADRLGVDPGLLLEALDGTAPDSPYAQLKGRAILAGGFEPQFEVAGLLKDVRLARAETERIAPELLDALERLYGETADEGAAGDDIAAVWRAFQHAAPVVAAAERRAG